MPLPFFIFFSVLAVSGAIALVAFKNPVSSALSMVVAFLGLAALFIGLDAFFVGIIQILVYAGAIMVLFIFIIMLLDFQVVRDRKFSLPAIATGVVLPLLFVVQVFAVLQTSTPEELEPLDFELAAELRQPLDGEEGEPADAVTRDLLNRQLPDTALIGHQLFGSQKSLEPGQAPQGYNFPIQITGVLLLVSTVGVVVLSRKPAKKSELSNQAEA